jgi:hypothetical protein
MYGDKTKLSTACTMLFKAVSAPMLNSEPGRLLSMLAGRQMTGISNAG